MIVAQAAVYFLLLYALADIGIRLCRWIENRTKKGRQHD
jgi:hypothetical protein